LDELDVNQLIWRRSMRWIAADVDDLRCPNFWISAIPARAARVASLHKEVEPAFEELLVNEVARVIENRNDVESIKSGHRVPRQPDESVTGAPDDVLRPARFILVRHRQWTFMQRERCLERTIGHFGEEYLDPALRNLEQLTVLVSGFDLREMDFAGVAVSRRSQQ
jgi:hypothetical protein